MFFHLPERIFHCIRDDEQVAALEEQYETLCGDSITYTPEKMEKESALVQKLTMATMKALKDAPDEVKREARIMFRCEKPEYLLRQMKLDHDIENRLCCCYQLTNLNIAAEKYRDEYLYLYNQMLLPEKQKLSAIFHNVYFIFSGERIADDVTAGRAVEKLMDLRHRILSMPGLQDKDKLDKTTAVEFISHLYHVYMKNRHTISEEDARSIAGKCLDMSKWNGKVYDTVWIGNFRTTHLLYCILHDAILCGADKDDIAEAKEALAAYLMTSLMEENTTIKSLTTHNEDFRGMYLILVNACLNLLNLMDKDRGDEVAACASAEVREYILNPPADTAEVTPVSSRLLSLSPVVDITLQNARAFETELNKEYLHLVSRTND